VIQCIQSWGVSSSEIQAALSYFTGICANHIDQNPGIVTAIPTTITLIPTPSIETQTVTATEVGASPPPPPPAQESVPCTTISISTTFTVSETQTTVYTTEVTVPQVQFITTTAAPVYTGGAAPSIAPETTQEVGLIPGPTYVPPEATAAPVPGAAATTFGTSIVVAPTGQVANATSDSPFAVFTGAASKQQIGLGVAGFAMMMAVFL
jgi:hypothetical protein